VSSPSDPQGPPDEAPDAPRPGLRPSRARALGWLRRWGISVASLIGGLFTLFVFRRELPHARWIIGYLLLLFLLFAVVAQVRRALEARAGRLRLVLTAADYTMQTLYHGILLFLLPAYWASTTLTSRNAVFLGVLIVLALLATFDPWYRAVAHPFPWVTHVFLLVCIFGALNVALPLVGVPPHPALLLSAVAAVLALTPEAHARLGGGWRTALAVTGSLAIAAALGVNLVRAWIPPAPLFLASRALAWNVASIDSLEPVAGAIGAAELRERGLVAYTPVYAPAGLSQSIRHVWRREGETVDVVTLSPVSGGRREGFRTFSRKTAFPADPTGRWSVDVVTGSGQLIGRLRFRVVP
jgi:hypothetical protein